MFSKKENKTSYCAKLTEVSEIRASTSLRGAITSYWVPLQNGQMKF